MDCVQLLIPGWVWFGAVPLFILLALGDIVVTVVRIRLSKRVIDLQQSVGR